MKHDVQEQISFQTAEFLRKNCPSLIFEKSGKPYGCAGSIWHGCECRITGNSCICVWHLTDKCHQGKWDMPFLLAEKEKIKREQQIAIKAMDSVPKEILTKNGVIKNAVVDNIPNQTQV